jgi:hypothetical protein
MIAQNNKVTLIGVVILSFIMDSLPLDKGRLLDFELGLDQESHRPAQSRKYASFHVECSL